MRNVDGFTMVEVLTALGITVTLLGSMVLAYLGVQSINMMSRHKIQAVQVVRGQIENLKSTNFTSIVAGTQAASYDAGSDGVYGTADDMRGTLSTTLQDFLDFDNDGNMVEALINVDNSGGNDTVALPVRVSFAWTEYVIGQSKNMSVSVDTIIAS